MEVHRRRCHLRTEQFNSHRPGSREGHSYNGIRDEQLITLIAKGEEDALAVFYDRHASLVFSVAKYMLKETCVAEEVTQDVFLNLWLKASSYNPQRGSPGGWFMSIARHRIIDVIRRGKQRTQNMNHIDHELLDLHASPLPSTEEQVERNLAREQIITALSFLPEVQRKVIILAYFEGYTQSEIAGKLDEPLGTVKTRMRRGMRKLYDVFAK